MKKTEPTESSQYFEGLFGIADSAVVIVDADGNILRVNPAFTKILGYEEHEILGKPFYTTCFKSEVMQDKSSHFPLYRFQCSEKNSVEYPFFDKQAVLNRGAYQLPKYKVCRLRIYNWVRVIN